MGYLQISRLTIFITIVFICFVIFILSLLFVCHEETSMLICRIISLAAAFGLFICTYFLIEAMSQSKPEYPEKIFSIPTSIKLFQLAMTIISFSGHYLRVSFILILFNYDFALNYSSAWFMAATEGIYILAMFIYLPTQLLYLWFHILKSGFFEAGNEKHKKFIFAFTLILNFAHKWLFETLMQRERICEKLESTNHPCIGHRHYRSNISMMSVSETEAFKLMEISSSLSYSCTMELLVVYLVVLCYCKPKIRKQNICDTFSRNFELISVKKERLIKIGMMLSIILALLCMCAKIITLAQDDQNPRIFAIYALNVLKFLSMFVEFFVFIFLCFNYWNIKPRKWVPNNTIIIKSGNCFIDKIKTLFAVSFLKFLIFFDYIIFVKNDILKEFWLCSLFFSSNDTDFLILKILWYVELNGIEIRILLYLINFKSSTTEGWLFSIIPTVFNISTGLLNLKLLNSFLSGNSEDIKKLALNSFTKDFMIPYQIIRSFIRAINHYVVALDPNIVVPNNVTVWNLFFNAAYPLTPLMFVTSALCWSHVAGKFFSHRAYNFLLKDNEEVYESESESEDNF